MPTKESLSKYKKYKKDNSQISKAFKKEQMERHPIGNVPVNV